MMEYLKGAKGSWIWLIIRLYVGYKWITAGWGKLTSPEPFDASGFLMGALKKTEGAHPAVQPWWGSFIENFALPNVGLFNFLVPWGEFLVGLALIVGFATIFAALMGMVMNFAFLFSGTTSINPQLLLLEFVLVAVGGAYAGYLGVDYWFRPWFRKQLASLFSTADSTAKTTA